MESTAPSYLREPGLDHHEVDADLDEELDVSEADRSVWLLKVPDFLYHRWSRASARGDDRLGTLRVHPGAEADDPPSGFSIYLPDDLARGRPDALVPPAHDAIPSEYEVIINNEHSTNVYVFGENDAAVGAGRKRQRAPSIAGTVKHECSVKPAMTDDYKRIMRERAERAAEPKRKMQRYDADLGTLNRMAAGVGNVDSAAQFKGFVKPKARGADRAVRLSRPDLESHLFSLFDERAYWSLLDINTRVRQPLTYLKEVLADLAQQLNGGPYKGQFALKSAFKGKATRVDEEAGAAEAAKAEDDDDALDFDEIA